MRGPKAGHLVRIAIDEQTERVQLRQILRVDAAGIGVLLKWMHEWPNVNAARGIYEMQFRWRSKRPIAVLRGEVVRSKKSRKQQRRMHQDQKDQQRYWAKCFVHGYTARIRGSLQYSNTSASTLPRIRKTEDSMTT